MSAPRKYQKSSVSGCRGWCRRERATEPVSCPRRSEPLPMAEGVRGDIAMKLI